MNAAGDSNPIEPFYLSGKSGRLFSICFNPPPGPPPEIGVLYVPPFTDEMNKSRRQVALQARQLAARGMTTLVVDLFGTGDSDGEFVDARWQTWVDDMVAALNLLSEKGVQRITLWGLRLGALLAMDVYHRFGGDIDRVVMWQPVISGKLFLGQFLRLRAAADMMSGDGGMDTKGLQQLLGSGEIVEIAGYELHPELADEIQNRDLRNTQIEDRTQASWVEIVSTADQSLSPMALEVIGNWRNSGIDVHAETAFGEPFWSTPEITIVPELVDVRSFR